VDNRKSQHYNYTHETIPLLWHGQSDDFLRYLDKDGTVFLRFWWKHLADNLGISILSDSSGLSFQVKELSDKSGNSIKLVLLSLPRPENVGEVFYMALVKFPKKRTIFDVFMASLPNTRVIALQLEELDSEGNPVTGVYELTRRARNVRLGRGCEPVLDVFYKDSLKLFNL
jgi:hypothetical protein